MANILIDGGKKYNPEKKKKYDVKNNNDRVEQKMNEDKEI